MSDGITDAERECNCELCQQLRSARECQKLHGIIYFSTKELVDELTKREGVQELNVPDPDHGYTIHIYGC